MHMIIQVSVSKMKTLVTYNNKRKTACCSGLICTAHFIGLFDATVACTVSIGHVHVIYVCASVMHAELNRVQELLLTSVVRSY